MKENCLTNLLTVESTVVRSVLKKAVGKAVVKVGTLVVGKVASLDASQVVWTAGQ